jgi:hypothetical protein
MECRKAAVNNLKKLISSQAHSHNGGRFTKGVTETKSFNQILQEIEDYYLYWYITPFKCI